MHDSKVLSKTLIQNHNVGYRSLNTGRQYQTRVGQNQKIQLINLSYTEVWYECVAILTILIQQPGIHQPGKAIKTLTQNRWTQLGNKPMAGHGQRQEWNKNQNKHRGMVIVPMETVTKHFYKWIKKKKSMMCHSLINEKLSALTSWYGKGGIKVCGTCNYWEKNQLWGRNRNAALCQAASHHPVVDYFLITAHPAVFYSSHRYILHNLLMSTLVLTGWLI